MTLDAHKLCLLVRSIMNKAYISFPCLIPSFIKPICSKLKSHAKAYLRSEQVQADPLWTESKRRTEIVYVARCNYAIDTAEIFLYVAYGILLERGPLVTGLSRCVCGFSFYTKPKSLADR